MSKLSFDFENIKEFGFSHCNDFESDELERDYLFYNGKFIFWVSTENDIVSGIHPTRKEELEQWEYEATDEELAKHISDCVILNTPKYIAKFNEIIKYKQTRYGFN
jgi:hypothetical protein